jgi:transcriptional regulator with XRE-family HTH domain
MEVSMTISHNINPDRLRFWLNKCRLSQKELAAKIGTDVGTVSRWKTGKTRKIRSNKLAKLCEVLGVTQTELCADGPLSEAGDAAPRGQVTMMLDTACRNALALVARRYGVTRQQIVEVAPLLFAIMAEQSLAERRNRLDGYHDAAPSHLRGSLRGPYDEDDNELLDAEERSIRQRDLFASHVVDRDENHHKSNPFAVFLSKRLSETDLKKGNGVTWEEDEAPRYQIGIEELIDLLGKDEDACKLVLSGEVALAEMPGDTRKATPEVRASWVKEKADLEGHKLRTALKDLEWIVTDQIVAVGLEAAEDVEHGF